MLKCKKLTYAFDLDSTLCTLSKSGKYNDVEPLVERIAKVNELHDHGHRIVIYTARGMGKCNGDASWAYDEWFIFTRNQLYLWNVKHDRLIMGKASYDVIVDDKAVRDVDFFKTRVTVPKFTTSGIITGVFDVIHPGYTQMIRTAKSECDNIFALIHIDPSLENPRKSKPILTVSERVDTMRELLRSSDVVTCYKTEAELFKLLILLQNIVRAGLSAGPFLPGYKRPKTNNK